MSEGFPKVSEAGPHMMELWVRRDAIEVVVRAAVAYAVAYKNLLTTDVATEIDRAITDIQMAVSDAFEDSLDTTPL